MTWPLKGSGGKLYLGGLELEAKIFLDPAFQSRFWGLNLVWMPANRLKRKWKLGGLGGPNNFQTSPKFRPFEDTGRIQVVRPSFSGSRVDNLILWSVKK